jgi:hypothetical protein
MATPTTSTRLNSWKEIADYLQRDVRTAMRWAKADGLPVYRVGGGTRRVVYAYASEIDDWLANGRARSEAANGHGAERDVGVVKDTAAWWRSRAVWLIGTAVVLLGGLAVGSRFVNRPPIARASVVGRDLVAYDAAGRDLWRRPIAEVNEQVSTSSALLVRWDEGGPEEVLVAAPVQRLAGDGTGALMLFNRDGRLRWRRVLEDRYVFGDTEYGPTWFPTDLRTYRVGDEVRVAAAFHHHTWWPGLVAAFDRDGRQVSTFINPGWLHHLNTTRDGRHLLVSGVSNALGGAVLAVLDVEQISGTPPSQPGAPGVCANCPAGAPVAYFVVPWSDLARPSDTPTNVVQVNDAGQIELRAVQRVPRDGVVPELIITLSPTFEVERRAPSDSFVSFHTQMEREGAIDHSMAACPWRVPPVRKWTPSRGWQDVK